MIDFHAHLIVPEVQAFSKGHVVDTSPRSAPPDNPEAAEQWRRYSADSFAGARDVAEWKARIRTAWPRMAMRRLDQAVPRIGYGETLRFEIAVNDEFVKPAIDAIIKGARTGKIGDGKIFVVPLDKCIRVRTSETGVNAIG